MPLQLRGLGTPLPREFYERPTLRVARDLLGCLLVHRTREGSTGGIIVEVEAYCGPRDRGAHSFDGRRTARNEVMYGPAGHAYVYFTYGMHFCLNVVTRPEGIPHAVLLRALEPVLGIPLMRTRRRVHETAPDHALARGPGNLCRAMGVDRGQNGADLTASSLRLYTAARPRGGEILRTPRIGIDYAGEDAARLWRFLVSESPAVSGRRIRAASGT